MIDHITDLTEAMFLASESYSVSIFGPHQNPEPENLFSCLNEDSDNKLN